MTYTGVLPMSMKSQFSSLDEVSRRDFVSHAAQSLLGLSVLPLIGGRALAQDPVQEGLIPLGPATAKNVIYLFMQGGMSQIDTFDPKPGTDNQGPVEAIKTSADGVLVSQHFPNLARHMDKVAIISSMHTTQGSHAQGQYYMHTTYELRGTIRHPSMGAWVNRLAGKINPTLPGHVLIGGSANTASGGFFEAAYYPLPIGDPEAGLQNSALPPHVSEESFHHRLDRVAQMNRAFAEKHDQKQVRAYADAYQQAIELMNSSDLQAFDISKESERLRDAYGSNPFGQGCLLARRLVEHDLRYVEVVLGGWDTHIDNFERLEDLCPVLDRALSALLADLESRGMLEETMVVLATEFGRTPQIVTGRNGRNHFPKAFSCLLAGGGINGGQRHGQTDERGEFIILDGVTVPDFNATIAHALGLPLDHVIYSPSRRPFTVADKGRPVMSLFG